MLTFAWRWLNNPLSIGAVAPSSSFLAAQMVKALDLAEGCREEGARPVCLELGPGTGAFTASLLRAASHDYRVILVEKDPAFFSVLKKKFPKTDVLNGDVLCLQSLLKGLGVGQVCRILSGLPLRAMPEKTVMALCDQISDILEPGGVFTQFTYFSRAPFPKDYAQKKGLVARRVALVLLNFPPAFVWRYERV